MEIQRTTSAYEVEKAIDSLLQTKQFTPSLKKVFTLPPNEKRKESLVVESMNKLGEGQFGKVYEIKYKGEPAALKIVNKLAALSSQSQENMLDEIRIIQQLEKRFPSCSQNLICYYDISQDATNIYLISEKLDNDYFDLISNDEYCKYPIKTKGNITYYLLIQMLNALKTLHNVGILHRDIKPENFLMKNSTPQVIKISDFGFGCFYQKGSTSEPICKGKVGSLPYASPDVLLGENEPIWTTNDDLYSLACVIYGALTCIDFMNDNELITKIKEIRNAKLNEIVEGKKWYMRNFERKMAYLEKMIIRQEEKDNQKDVKLRKLYNFCEELLNPENKSIHSVDDMLQIIQSN